MNKQISKLVIGLLALLAFTEANANSTFVTSITPSAGPNSSILSPSAGVYAATGNGTFTDVFTFSTGSVDTKSSWDTFVTIFNPKQNTNTTVDGSLAIGGNTFDSIKGLSNGFGYYFHLNANSNYTLDVTSNVSGQSPGGFGVVFSRVALVPEPTETALLIAGLGLVGFMVYRRKTNVAGVAVA